MADVAEHVGVSRTLVSMVIRGAEGPSAATRTRILAAAEELGYHPDIAARTLRGSSRRRIGVLFDLRQPFQVELVEEVYRRTGSAGLDVVVGPLTSSRPQDLVLRELLGYRADALLVIAPSVDLGELGALSRQLPVVEVGRAATADHFGVVRTDDADGVRQGVDHLVALGHRLIAHIDGGTEPGAAERRDGYLQRMDRHGLAAEAAVLPGDYTEEGGARAASVLLERPERPTAIIAGNDRAAVGVLDAARGAGLRVPEDLSVMGYDDSSFARLAYIGLTSVRQDAAALATVAVDAVVERMGGTQPDARERLLLPELVVRGSTGPLRT